MSNGCDVKAVYTVRTASSVPALANAGQYPYLEHTTRLFTHLRSTQREYHARLTPFSRPSINPRKAGCIVGRSVRPKEGILLNKTDQSVATAKPCDRQGQHDRIVPVWRPYPCLLTPRELQQVIAEQLG